MLATDAPEACTAPDVDPNWFDSAAPRQDRRRAAALCHACPVLRSCRRDAERRLPRPTGVILGGLRWDRTGRPHEITRPQET
jgi:hypothetical protein